MFGYTADEALGKHVGLIVPPDRLAEEEDVLRRVSTGEGVHLETVRVTRDRRVLDIALTVSPVRDGRGQIVAASKIARDITERKRMERRLAILGEVARSITASLDLDTVLQRIAIGARDLCASDTAALFLRDGDAMVPRYRVGDWLPAYDTLRITPGRGIGGAVMATGRPQRTDVYLADPRVGPDLHPVGHATGAVALMVVPIVLGPTVEGLLYVSNRHARRFTDDDERVVVGLAEQAAVAIQNARLYAQQLAARMEAEAADRAKDEFLATLSHELRTPLTAILGWARMLQSGQHEPAMGARALETIVRSARVLTQLIDDILDVARIRSGKLRLDVRPVRLAGVVEAAVESMRPAAEAKEIRLQPVLDPRAGPVAGDPDRLQQVVWNLLSNAIKFTPKKGRVQVRLERVNSHIEIVVSDDGEGIEPDLLPHVFGRFVQGDSTSTRRHGGLGLGLALVRSLVELHGGTVTAASEGRGRGATFTVKLPLMVRTDEPTGRVHPQAGGLLDLPAPSLAGVRVLVVEDSEDARLLLAQVLTERGAEVRTAASADEGLAALSVSRPHVLISDIEMPGTDGYAFLRAVRSRPAEDGGGVPAIAVTAYGRLEDRVRSLAAGYQMHVAKPVDPVELVAVVASLARSGVSWS
jgi:PAS domain S-box-containing protein